MDVKDLQPAFVDASVENFEVSTYSPVSSCRTVELRPKEKYEPKFGEPSREVLGSLM